MSVRIITGDSRDALPTLAADSFDACVTDPPYAIKFMSRCWDTGETAFDPAFWSEVLRVLRPGAHLLAFGGTRSYHRLACAIEDAGAEIRDAIMWHYGSGFPKSHDVSKGIDKAAGVEGTFGAPKSAAHAGWIDRGRMRGEEGHEGYQRPWMQDEDAVDRAARKYEPATEAARQWQGWGTALKPATEIIVLARKPLSEKTVAANVMEHGTGGLNIDGCRVAAAPGDKGEWPLTGRAVERGSMSGPMGHVATDQAIGRWPANVILDGSAEVLEAFARFGESKSSGGSGAASQRTALAGHVYGEYSGSTLGQNAGGLGDTGTAARFFYTAKADKADRMGTGHPTVKPVDLMAYLCRLVTPPGGTVLDPFAGSGTTGMACMREGFDCILIEREAEYVSDIRRRLAHVEGADTPLFAGAGA